IGRPIQNTTLLGYFAAVTGLISLEGVKSAILERFPGMIGKKNIEAAEKAFNLKKEAANV
ncbi:MAG: 2-oxoacid:acceptor oxidoreductase family protein, partial [candidate division Zixibacteria bacterium]